MKEAPVYMEKIIAVSILKFSLYNPVTERRPRCTMMGGRPPFQWKIAGEHNCMSDLLRAAGIYWKSVNNQTVSKEDFIFCIKLVWGDHKGSPFYALTSNLPDRVIPALSSLQPKIITLAEKWRPFFSGIAAITEEDARHFILDFHEALEEVEQQFKRRVGPGVTRCTRGTVSDFVTRRPNVKLGWTLQLTTQGKGIYNCIRSQSITQPGDMILLSPDALYDYQREPGTETWEHHWVYFVLEDAWLELLQWPEIGPNIFRLSSSGSAYEKLKTLFDELHTARMEPSDFSEDLTRNLLEQLLIRCRQLAPESGPICRDQRILKAKDYITRNFNKKFSVTALASEIGLSVTRLSALFKQHTGTTMVRWRDEHRMTRAAQLLTQTDQPVSQIAEIVGYEDALYFSRCFHQHSGRSPMEYRSKKRLPATLTLPNSTD
jgi:AraC family transcriptional regulator of arabinose operon